MGNSSYRVSAIQRENLYLYSSVQNGKPTGQSDFFFTSKVLDLKKRKISDYQPPELIQQKKWLQNMTILNDTFYYVVVESSCFSFLIHNNKTGKEKKIIIDMDKRVSDFISDELSSSFYSLLFDTIDCKYHALELVEFQNDFTKIIIKLTIEIKWRPGISDVARCFVHGDLIIIVHIDLKMNIFVYSKTQKKVLQFYNEKLEKLLALVNGSIFEGKTIYDITFNCMSKRILILNKGKESNIYLIVDVVTWEFQEIELLENESIISVYDFDLIILKEDEKLENITTLDDSTLRFQQVFQKFNFDKKLENIKFFFI
eukprot:gene11514-4678_t